MKTKRISARLSENAFNKLCEISQYSKLSKSELIERMILSEKIIIVSGLEEFIPTLKRAERNLNQVAARISMRQSVMIDINEVRKIYSEILKLLMQIKRGDIDGNY